MCCLWCIWCSSEHNQSCFTKNHVNYLKDKHSYIYIYILYIIFFFCSFEQKLQHSYDPFLTSYHRHFSAKPLELPCIPTFPGPPGQLPPGHLLKSFDPKLDYRFCTNSNALFRPFLTPQKLSWEFFCQGHTWPSTIHLEMEVLPSYPGRNWSVAERGLMLEITRLDGAPGSSEEIEM